MTTRDDLVNELLEENYDIVDIINMIWERSDGTKTPTGDLDVCEAIVGIMTDKEVDQVLKEIEDSKDAECEDDE